MRSLWIIVLFTLGLSAGGCANPTTQRVGPPEMGVGTVSQAANSAYYGDDAWSASFQGVTPTQAVLDADGINVQTGGQGTAMTALGELGVWSPKNVGIRGFEYETNPDGTRTIRIAEVTTEITSVIGAYTEQVLGVIAATEGMTQIEAERYVSSLEAAGEVAAEVARVVREAWIPTLPLE